MKARLKEVFTNKSINGFTDKQLLSATQAYGVVPNASLENRVMTATKNLDKFRLVEDGDFVVSLRSFEGGLELSKHEGVISPAYTVLTPQSKINETFFKYYFKSHDFIVTLNEFKKGIRDGQAIPFTQLKDVFISAPSLPKQVEIGLELNAITKLIDREITALTKKLTALEEYKTSLIHNAVTKGLDANGCRILDGTPKEQMEWKDSGVEWIGEIPDGWNIDFSKSALRFVSGKCIPSIKLNHNKNGHRYLKTNDVNEKSTINKDKYWYKNEDKDGVFKSLEQYVISFQGFNTMPYAGTLGMVSNIGEGYIDDHLYLIEPRGAGFDKSFVEFSIQTEWMTNHIMRNITGAISYSSSKYKNFIPISKPELKEQEAIAIYLRFNTGKLRSAKILLSKKIALLLEYKKSLINEAVSGELEV